VRKHWNPAMTTFLSGTALVLASAAVSLTAQRATPAELAAKLSGTWKINLELSPSLGAPGRRGGRAGGAAFAVAGFVPQRGGMGGGQGAASDLTPEERAARAAMQQLQQIAPLVTIQATADTVTFADARGLRAYRIDGKTAKVDVSGTMVNTKSRWDRAALRQEFEVPQSRLIQTWEVDRDGRLVLTARVESLTLMSTESKAVYDRQ